MLSTTPFNDRSCVSILTERHLVVYLLNIVDEISETRVQAN